MLCREYSNMEADVGAILVTNILLYANYNLDPPLIEMVD